MKKFIFVFTIMSFSSFLWLGCGGDTTSNSETCTDSVKNQNESDVDCGGICGPCADNKSCLVNNDCQSGNCENGTCKSADNDQCPDDPNKTEPGVCGCGVADDDSDSDGTLDCNDNCPNDADKTEPGTCGCGISDGDTDSDSIIDCEDNCPNDANPSQDDLDADGTGDVCDGCPDDADKTEEGQCGCGVADDDTDLDEVADCVDNCPDDANLSQTDTDADGVGDVCDGCPDDTNKIDPGQCGCGNPDTDSDLDGTADCNDTCPNDPDKVEPGVCGCGVADTDTDSDGTADCIDNCPNDPNDTQADADGDGLGDVCDPCPDPGPCYCHPMGWDACPSGATEWCSPDYQVADAYDSNQAELACDQCFDMSCVAESGDCAGNAWLVDDLNINPDEAAFGYEDGCSGPAGRIWRYGSSYTTYGIWAMPDPIAADSLTFADGNVDVPSGIAYSSSSYWSVSGGSSAGIKLTQHDALGAIQNQYSPGIDFRSLFTKGTDSTLFTRGFDSSDILRQDSPGVFTTETTLSGGTIDEQSMVAYDHVNNLYVANDRGTISRWDDSGNFVDTVSLHGFGSDYPGEELDFQGLTIAVSTKGYYLTYYNQRLSVWSDSGQRLWTTILTGSDASLTAYVSFSFTIDAQNGWVWIADSSNNWHRWRLDI